MSATEPTEQSIGSPQAVDEEYKKLEQKFFVERRRVVLVDENKGMEGGFGIVRRAELHHSAWLPAWLGSRQYGPPQLVAIKQIKISTVSNLQRVKRAFTREMFVWSSLEAHPGIAKFLGFYADFKRSEAWLLSPWEPNGNVTQFIKAHNLEVPEKLSLVYDTIDALNFLHQLTPPVCHGDIKAANVLVSAEYKARLCDFGLARLHEDSGFGRLETSTGMKGSIRWCSPEILKDAPRAPTSDVYAWAWLVWEIMTGDMPYQGTSADYAIMAKIFEGSLPHAEGAFRLSDCLQVWDLMGRCWNTEPGERPTARMCKTTVTSLPRCTPAPGNVDSQTRSPALLENLGDLESWKGNPKRSSAYLDEALQLYHAEENAKGITSVLLKQAAAMHRIDDCVKLRAIATTALEHCRSLNDALGIAEALYYLGHSIWMMEDSGDVEALPMLTESLKIRRAAGDDVGVVQCLERIGDIQRCNEKTQDALATLDEAVTIASLSGDRMGLANALHMVGCTHRDLSDFVKAADAFSEAITITRSVGWEAELSTNLYNMGYLKMQLGEWYEAEQLLQESISISRRIGSRLTLARGLRYLGECFHKQSKPNEAVSLLEEAAQLSQELSQTSDLIRIAFTLVELKSSQAEWDAALVWHDHIIAQYRRWEMHEKVADHLTAKGEILVKVQRYDEAAVHFEAAMVTRREITYFWWWEQGRQRKRLSQLRRQLCAIPKTTMKWERRLPLLCDLKKLQRRQPQLKTATLKLPIAFSSGEP